MWVIGLIVLAAFIAFLFFTPPMKVETAEKLLEKNNEPDDWHERRTNPMYSYLPYNIHHIDIITDPAYSGLSCNIHHRHDEH